MIGEPMTSILLLSGVALFILAAAIFVTRSFVNGLLAMAAVIITVISAVVIISLPMLIYKFIAL